EHVARRTLATGVRVVTAGSQPLSVDSVFESTRLASLLAEFSADGPAFLVIPPERMRDVAGVAEVVVAAAGSDRQLRQLLESLPEEGGLKRIGVILSDRSTESGVSTAPVIVAEPGTPTEEPGTRAAGPVEAGAPPAATFAQIRDERPAAVSPEPVTPRRASVRAGGVRRTGPATRTGAWIAVAAVVAAAAVYWAVVVAPERTTTPRVAEQVTPRRPFDEGDQTAGRDERPADARDPGDISGPNADSEKPERISTREPEQPSTRETERVMPGGTTRGQEPAGTVDVPVAGVGGPYRIIVSSHKHRADAEVERGQLASAGLATEIIPAEIPERGTWYRILVAGGYPSWTRATEVLDTIRNLGYEGAWIERTEQLESEEPGSEEAQDGQHERGE
ncbi:MAG: SPOR domain-containing protein, partial [Candidatus Eisenbacteria bacterium]|nr:SPOR domain-containing protein [Candidatus Eisenbacteria bacterium]